MRGKSLVSGVVLILLVASVALAQQQPRRFLEAYEFTVRPGAVMAFEDYVKKVVEAANKVGIQQEWTMFAQELGTPGQMYIVALYFDKWAERDGWAKVPEVLSKAYGEDEAAKIYRTGTSSIESSHSRVYQLLEEHGTKIGSAGTLASHYVVTETIVKRDMVSDYELMLSKIKAAEEAMEGSATAIRRVTALGDMSIYITSRPFEKFADVDAYASQGDAMRKMYGDEEARRIRETITRCQKSQRIFVINMRPELSRRAASTTN
jgi:hypothetical protein